MTDDDSALKTRHRAMRASGGFPRVSRDTVGGVGRAMVEAAGVAPGRADLLVVARRA